MLSRVLRTIRRHRLLGDSGTRRVLCAVSGGPDSMALLACLWELADRLQLTLGVAAVDHGLRSGAAAELALVAERAWVLGVPFHSLRVDVGAARASRSASSGPPAPRAGRGLQEVARRLRLAALAELCAAQGFDVVALGHQADDQAETILFRVLRGTGVAGLAGIPYRRAPFVRPLLDVTRAEIEDYLRRRSIPFATDPSNQDVRQARARIRHQILPLLRRENPRLDEALRRLGEDAATVTARSAGERGALSNASRTAGVHVPGRTAADIAAAVRDAHGTRLFDVPGARVRVSYGQVHLESPGALVSGGSTPSLEIPRPGEYPIGQARIVSVREDDGSEVPDEEGEGIRWAWFDRDALGWPLRVRPSRPGDRMRPRGGRGSRKLSDLLIDAKIPRPARAALPVVTDGDGTLLFVPGLRPSQRGAPGPGTRGRIGLAVVTIPDHHPSVDPSIASGNTQRYRDPKGLS
jgi:tRNA(Ile)-lysidine synthase